MNIHGIDTKSSDVFHSPSSVINEEMGTNGSENLDEAVLAKFGKKQQLRVRTYGSRHSLRVE